MSDTPIADIALKANAALRCIVLGDIGQATTLIREVSDAADALLNVSCSDNRAAIEELKKHGEALRRFYDN